MKGKPTPWGIKFFFLCGVSGFPYSFIPYQGASTSFPEEFKPYGIGGAVVLSLVTTRIPENSLSSLFIDRFFTSPPLVKKLLDYGVYTTGTVNTLRIGKPPVIGNKAILKKSRGYMEGCLSKDGSQCLVKWKDSNNVCVLSSAYTFHETQLVQRYDKKVSNIPMSNAHLISYITIKIWEVLTDLIILFHFIGFISNLGNGRLG